MTREYLDTKLKIIRLQLTERTSRLIASLMVDVVKVILALFVVFFLSLALGFYLSELLGSNALGFLATGGIFILLIGIIMLMEASMERSLMDRTIKKLLQKWYDEDDENSDEKGNTNQ